MRKWPTAADAKPVADRLWEGVTIDGAGCWVFARLDDRGYGRMWIGSRTDGSRHYALVHRLCYELHEGPIPHGLHLDHLCRNRACCNPAHLEPVTAAENLRRAPSQPSTVNAAKTHCLRGHTFDESNIYMHRGKRYCRECLRIRGRAAYARKKANA